MTWPQCLSIGSIDIPSYPSRIRCRSSMKTDWFVSLKLSEIAVGDDFLVTNAARIRKASLAGACNAVLVKPNQAGTIAETVEAVEASRTANWGAILSARSGETEDVTIVHLAVGWGVRQLKVGSFSRSERMAKWNEGIR